MHVITREEIALVRLLNKFEYIFAGKTEGCPCFFFFFQRANAIRMIGCYMLMRKGCYFNFFI